MTNNLTHPTFNYIGWQFTMHLIARDWAMMPKTREIKRARNWSSIKQLSNYHKQIVINSIRTNWINIRTKPKKRVFLRQISPWIIARILKVWAVKCDMMCYHIWWIFYQLQQTFPFLNNFDLTNCCAMAYGIDGSGGGGGVAHGFYAL